MLVSDFKVEYEERFIKKFFDTLPEVCFEDSCESPLEITMTLTSLSCSNPRCPAKVRMRLIAMLREIGVKGIGVEVARKFIEKFGIDNPLLIFGYEPHEDGTLTDSMSDKVSYGLFEQIQAKNKFTLAEFVRLAQLPHVQTSADKIFEGYADLEEAYEDIEDGGVEFITERLGIKKASVLEVDSDLFEDTVSIRALKIYESLMTYKADLFEVEEFINFIDLEAEDLVVLKAVCSDEVGMPFKTKKDFYATVNNLYEGKVHVDFLKSVNKSIDYLIWAGADGKTPARYTNKVDKVTKFNKQYEDTGKGKRIPIMTAKDFLAELQSKFGN